MSKKKRKYVSFVLLEFASDFTPHQTSLNLIQAVQFFRSMLADRNIPSS